MNQSLTSCVIKLHQEHHALEDYQGGVPRDVAAAVCFLASEAAGYITGATLHVTGGRYAT